MNLLEPRIERREGMLVAGLCDRFTIENVALIPLLWQRFAPRIGRVPGQVGQTTYGVRINQENQSFDYIAAVEVSSLDRLTDELNGLRIPAATYALFSHRDLRTVDADSAVHRCQCP